MAEAPSPYAPGIIAEERAPPRQPGQPVVFLVATFAMTALAAGLWQVWASTPRAVTLEGGGHLDLFRMLATAPGPLALLWAYLTDRVPLLGSRRDGYVMLTALMMAAVWLGIAAANDHPLAWQVAAVPFGLAGALSRAAIVGALAEIGRRGATTGRLAAANVGLAHIAAMAARPVMMSLGLVSIWAAAGVAIGLALAVVLLIVTLSDDEVPALPAGPETRVGSPSFLRSRALWASLPALVCAGAAATPDALITMRVRATHDLGVETWQMQQWLKGAAMIAAAIGYALLCRRIPFRSLLRLTLLLKALLLVACGGTLGSGESRALDLAVVVLTFGDGLLTIAVLDLGLRAARPGREAFGCILLVGVWTVATLLSGAVGISLTGSATTWAWFAAGAAIIGAFAASLLPPAIGGTSDSPVLRSPP